MIAIFLLKQDAQNFTDKCHNWLMQNCPNYCGVKWQDPTPNKDSTKFFIEIPDEYYKEYYKDCKKIITATKTEYDKNNEIKEKPGNSIWFSETTK